MTADQAAGTVEGAEARTGGAVDEVGVVGVVFAALADPTRRRLLDVLADSGRASATTLAGRLPVSRRAVVKHLQVLETAGLVERTRAAREVLYSVRTNPLDASARWLADRSASWDRRLNAVKQAAETGTDDLSSRATR